ncbi:DUF1249 domain-containing protein [Solilutibacter silvestris]|uniref:DUF1249 domain-containing protein n=1 Tax=Solilutibacter silvestris TaxID=1645665 RepID=UPI003D32AA99
MALAHAPAVRIPHISRFGLLMGLYAENHGKLTRLLAPARLPTGSYLSHGDDGLDLRLDILEQHRYTTELRLTYTVIDPVTGEPDPSAFVRLYRDARQAEATHCHVGRRWQDVVGMYPPPRAIIDHRLRMNIFLGKWLDLLAIRGHGHATLKHIDVESVAEEA